MMELLAPAGGYEALTAAVQNGADAVYMGFGAFNARRSAKNFTDEEFASAVRYCHLRGVRVFLTLNTLLTDRELPGAAAALRKASAMGVDAVLVQDWGLLTLAKEIVPDLPLHASTQLSLCTLGGAFAAAALGMDAVLLTAEGSDPLYRRAVRVSMGTVFQVPWTYLGEDWMGQLNSLGFKTAAMALTDKSLPIYDRAPA